MRCCKAAGVVRAHATSASGFTIGSFLAEVVAFGTIEKLLVFTTGRCSLSKSEGESENTENGSEEHDVDLWK